MIRGYPRVNQRQSALQGQIVLEYFILFAAIAVISILGILVASGKRSPEEMEGLDLRGKLQAYFRQAANRITK